MDEEDTALALNGILNMKTAHFLLILLSIFSGCFLAGPAHCDEVAKAAPVSLSHDERAWLEAHPKIVLGIEASWDPLVSIGDDWEISGIEVETLNPLHRKMGSNNQLKTEDWAEMVAQAKARKIDGLAGSIETTERRKYFVFSDIYGSHSKQAVNIQAFFCFWISIRCLEILTV